MQQVMTVIMRHRAWAIRLAALLAISSLPLSANAALLYNQNVTNNAIYGAGNLNGNFTLDRNAGVELGLRGKLSNTTSNGDGTYNTGLLSVWNFDFSVNSNWDGSSSFFIDDLTYQLGIDYDEGAGTTYLVFDPITPNVAPLNAPFFDHSIGDNSTAQGAGAEAANAGTYLSLTSTKNLLQQSWRHAFFQGLIPGTVYNFTENGNYEIYLKAFSGSTEIASTNITVIAGAGAPLPPAPEPSTCLMLLTGVCGMMVARRRKVAAC